MEVFKHIIYLTPFYVSLFWGLVFLSYPLKENRARFYLGIFMLVASILYFSHAVFFELDYSLYMHIDGIYLLSGLSVYPLYYIYIRQLTIDITSKKTYIWHFLPALLLSLILEILSFYASPVLKQSYLNDVLIAHRWPSGAPGIEKSMAFVFYLSRLIFGIQSIVYLILGLILIRKYNKRIANFYSNLIGKKLAWLELLTITLIIAAFSSFLLNILGRNFFVKTNTVILPSAIFSTILFIIGLLGNKQNQTIVELVRDEQDNEKKIEKNYSALKLKENLLFIMDTEKPYLNPNFRITDLTFKLSSNRTYLSNLINSEFKMSFSDFVNNYRIQYAKRLMNDDVEFNFSLIYFSENSGFGSVSTFIRAFKQFEGITAGAYRNQILASTVI